MPHSRLTMSGFVAVLRRFWPFVARHKGKFFLGILLILVSVPLSQFAVFLTRDVTNKILVSSGETVEARWAAVLGIVGIQACFWLVSSLLGTAREVLEWYVSMRTTYDLRIAFYRHLYRLPLSFLQRRSPGEHVYRATEDLGPRDGDGYAPGVMGMIARQVPLLFEAAYGVLWGGFLLYLVDPRLALMLALYVVPFALCAHAAYDRLRLSAFKMRGMAEREVGVLRDSVAGLRTIKAAGRTALQRIIYARAASDTKRLQNQLSFQTVITTQGLVWLFRFAFNLAVFVYMTHRVISGGATIGDWVVSFLLVAEAQLPLEKAVQVVQQIRILMVPAQRILETLDREPDHADKPNATVLRDVKGEVAFSNVNFGYEEGVPVLRDVSLAIRPNEHVGFVGPSGAGKSSLLGLLLRLHVPNSGTIRVDGVPVADLKLDSLLDRCAVVPQNSFLYEGTIYENVLYGRPDAAEAEVRSACERAGVLKFANRFPDGLDTFIGEGTMLSGGERQRICIARALVRKPRILIFDEATASLDAATESEILDCLLTAAKGRTTISVAHRLRAVARCDRIFVLERGEVRESGTHAELLAQGGLYARLWAEQYGAFDSSEGVRLA